MQTLSETKIILPESEIPEQWYNIAADLPNPPAPPLHPGTHEPLRQTYPPLEAAATV